MSGELFFSSLISNSVLIGIGATLVMDAWALFLRRFFGITSLNYALVGRWLGYMPRGIFRHDNVGAVKPVFAELIIGWGAHYLIGIIFAAALILFSGDDWLVKPNLIPAITVGALTVGFPFFIMQPCMGLGVAASKTPQPNVARFRSVLTHLVFGFGLYLSAIISTLISMQ